MTPDEELALFRHSIPCGLLLETAGWMLDRAESTARNPKYRLADSSPIIVTHSGLGWFDPVQGTKGDVIGLAQHLWGVSLGHARIRLRALAGTVPMPPIYRGEAQPGPRRDMAKDWGRARVLMPGSRGWGYLAQDRALPDATIQWAVRANVLREGIAGTVWAAHFRDRDLTGWEMRGPNYRGYAQDGTKCLFTIGVPGGRIVFTEAFIDALSLATLERYEPTTLYVSTGGGWSDSVAAYAADLIGRSEEMVAATDNGKGGGRFAGRLELLALPSGIPCSRLRPAPDTKDWNDQLKRTSLAA